MGRHLLIGTPCYDGKLCVAYVRGLIDTERALRDAGVRLDLHFTLQSSLVMHARNEIVAAFLASDATDLLFIDSDIGWQARDVLRLLGHDVALVAGVYRRKTEAISFVVKFPQASAVRRERATGLIAASRVGAGFLRLRRDALTRMVGAYPQLRYLPGGQPPEAPLHALFDTSLIDGDLCGEDWTFCARWQAIGGTVWVDPAIALVHIGTASFGGVLTDALRSVS
jgi:hypothetical protein